MFATARDMASDGGFRDCCRDLKHFWFWRGCDATSACGGAPAAFGTGTCNPNHFLSLWLCSMLDRLCLPKCSCEVYVRGACRGAVRALGTPLKEALYEVWPPDED